MKFMYVIFKCVSTKNANIYCLKKWMLVIDTTNVPTVVKLL